MIHTTLALPLRVPATGLDAAIAVARKVSESDGLMTRDSLAIALGHKKGSGNANNKILAAQRFGLIQRSNEATYSITDLGRRCISPTAREDDLKNAISRVKPFAKVVNELSWQFSTEDPVPIDQALRTAGMASDAAVEARRVLIRSMAMLRRDQPSPSPSDIVPAGDGSSAEEDAPKHIAPRARIRRTPSPVPQPEPEPEPEEESDRLAARVGADDGPAQFADIPAIRGLLDAAPDQGTPWPRSQQDDFVEAMRHLIRFSYGPGE